MKTPIESKEVAKSNRFTVLDNGQEVVNTSKREEADTIIGELQAKQKPMIVLLDDLKKSSIRYTKTINQKNYRIEAGDFEKDRVPKPSKEAAAPVTEE